VRAGLGEDPLAAGGWRGCHGGGAEGPGRRPARGPRRINAVLTAVRGFVAHAVTCGTAPGRLLPLVYELADVRDLPEQARGEDGAMAWRMRARHRLHEPDAGVDRASDGEVVALIEACRSGREPTDRLPDGAGRAAPM